MEKKEKRVTLEVTQDFKFAHRGCDVVAYEKGQVIEVEEECAEIAVREKWAKPAKGKKAAAETTEVDPPAQDDPADASAQ